MLLESCDVTAKPGELCPKQTLEEYRTEFTIWAMASSPLLVSTDVRNLTSIQRDVLLNTEVIAIDQQPVAGDELKSLALRLWAAQQNGKETALDTTVPFLTNEEENEQWFTGQEMQACDYPHCCPTPDNRCKRSAFPLFPLGSGVKTAADCLKLCEAHAKCDVWQLGSPSRGGHCVWVQNMTAWSPVASSGNRTAGCKLDAVRHFALTTTVLFTLCRA